MNSQCQFSNKYEELMETAIVYTNVRFYLKKKEERMKEKKNEEKRNRNNQAKQKAHSHENFFVFPFFVSHFSPFKFYTFTIF